MPDFILDCNTIFLLIWLLSIYFLKNIITKNIKTNKKEEYSAINSFQLQERSTQSFFITVLFLRIILVNKELKKLF